jgi:LemA protein
MRLVFAIMMLMVSLMSIGCVEKYDTLVTKDETCSQVWSDYEAQLQRRSDMIPQLVETVKGSALHESQTLKDVQEARSAATQIKLTADDLSDPDKMAKFQAAQNQIKGSLSRLMMVQEQYPDLKANKAFHDLQVQIEGTENRILRSRQEYNKAVQDYNVELRRVSGKAINPLTGHEFKPRVYFSADPASTVAPKINFAPTPAPSK